MAKHHEQIQQRKTVVHAIPEPDPYAVGLSDDSVQHIPWSWSLATTTYPQIFQAASVQR